MGRDLHASETVNDLLDNGLVSHARPSRGFGARTRRARESGACRPGSVDGQESITRPAGRNPGRADDAGREDFTPAWSRPQGVFPRLTTATGIAGRGGLHS